MRIPMKRLKAALNGRIGHTLTAALADEILAEVMAPGRLTAFDPPPWPCATPADLLELMAGNEDAVRLIQDVVFVSHRYDDLIDGDKPVPDEDIHRLIHTLLIDVPVNPFWAQHAHLFRPLVETGILNWHAANQIEAEGHLEELRIAHALRYAIGDIVLLAMTLAGGHAHAVAHARKARLLAQQDTWRHYRSEHLP
jgi:hypothetical protein